MAIYSPILYVGASIRKRLGSDPFNLARRKRLLDGLIEDLRGIAPLVSFHPFPSSLTIGLDGPADQLKRLQEHLEKYPEAGELLLDTETRAQY